MTLPAKSQPPTTPPLAKSARRRFTTALGDVLIDQEFSAYSPELWEVLANLPAVGVAPEHAAHVVRTWCLLLTRRAPEPHIEVTPTGTVLFGWNNPRAVVTLEVGADGALDWWTKDRETGQVAGTEDEDEGAHNLPSIFWRTLRLARGA